MKKIVLVFIINLILNHNGTGQNLVPNGSFEMYDTCPSSTAEIKYVLQWCNPTLCTPDYYNSCDNTNYVSVPNNLAGVQLAKTGNAYAGIYTYYGGGEQREYLQVKLDSILLPQHLYCVEFYMSLADYQPVACNNIGMYFSDTAIRSNNIFAFNLLPQINNNTSTNPITNKIGWTKISGIFIATGGEQYITIGNFINDTNSDTVHVPSGGGFVGSYYYVDAVSVVDCTNSGISEITNPNSEILISPNPATSSITITSSTNIKEIKLINLLGQCVLSPPPSFKEGAGGWSVDISSLSKGIYFVEVTDDRKNVANRKIVVQ